MNDRMLELRLYSHRDNNQSHETLDRVVHVVAIATSANASDEKGPKAYGALLSGF